MRARQNAKTRVEANIPALFWKSSPIVEIEPIKLSQLDDMTH